jgi:hypothetical protein
VKEISKDEQALGDAANKAAAAYPTWDFVKGLKSATLTKQKGTKVEYKISGKKDLLALADARKKAAQIEMDAGAEYHAKQRKATVRVKGQEREVPEAYEERLYGQDGVQLVRRVKPTAIYRDGQWYRKIHGDWVPEE